MISAPGLAVVATALVVLSACGGSDSDEESVETTVVETTEPADPSEDFTAVSTADDVADTDDAGTTDTAPQATEPATPATDPGTTDPGTTDPGTTDSGDGAAGEAIAASLVEWAIEAPAEYTAGDVTFTVSNDGQFPHEFVVIRGDGYESLPLEDGGAVDEAALDQGALVDRADRIGAGDSVDLTVSLEPGNYVLLCNLGSGGNSHAGQGQVLDITVT
jgi:hypothetical protein